MNGQLRAALAGVVALLLLAGCGAATAGAAAPVPPEPDYGPFSTRSMCDQFGHRVFSYPSQGTIAVVPNDRSCPQPNVRATDR